MSSTAPRVGSHPFPEWSTSVGITARADAPTGQLFRVVAGACVLPHLSLAQAAHPFVPGDRAEYDVRYGPAHAGTGTLSVLLLYMYVHDVFRRPGSRVAIRRRRPADRPVERQVVDRVDHDEVAVRPSSS